MILSVINLTINKERSQRRLNTGERLRWKSMITIYSTYGQISTEENQPVKINGAESLSGGIEKNMEIATLHPASRFLYPTSPICHAEMRFVEGDL